MIPRVSLAVRHQSTGIISAIMPARRGIPMIPSPSCHAMLGSPSRIEAKQVPELLVQVWFLVANWTGTAAIQQGADEEDLEQWWNKALEQCNDRRRRSIAAILMYIAWHIWKERKRRVFDNKIRRPDQVLGLIQEDICLHRQACGKPLIEAELNLS
uniref:Uncharacterized protein n=1 Tax=Setaria viridis TaxID=4556 RepID=A0A4U6W3C7_SETVI|nr:hypothetical protein SEVIR_2G445300v2 [Setaria viridis]